MKQLDLTSLADSVAARAISSRLARFQSTLGRASVYLILAIAALIFLLPAWFAFVNSFKPLAEIQSGALLGLPKVWTLDAWGAAWGTACTGGETCSGLKGYFITSFIIAVPAVAISTMWACFNGYVLSKWRFRGRELVFFVLLFGLFLPWGLYLLPLSRIVAAFGLGDSLIGLIAVHIIYSMPQALFFRNYFMGFPGELIKAARIDGAGLFTIFWRIVLPTAKPIFIVVVIMQFTYIWNDFMFALVLSPTDAAPVTVGLNNLTNSQLGSPQYNVYMAAAFITGLPTILLYVLAGKYFVRGLTGGAVKG
ncbi:carbohydrate ABC transporter permease [Burkholderia savannae]|uniref:carbohydrate ABC transporter permease n=1 Tax=Burkholderia savannae TaxID=1637837 RepID=UPI0009EB82B8|nr:carbohydrate ABC transporter permease [Burkholderia savannae]